MLKQLVVLILGLLLIVPVNSSFAQLPFGQDPRSIEQSGNEEWLGSQESQVACSGGSAFCALVNAVKDNSLAIENIQGDMRNKVFAEVARIDIPTAINIVKNLLTNGKEDIAGKLMNALTKKDSSKAAEVLKGLDNNERIKVVKKIDAKLQGDLIIAIAIVDKTAAGEIIKGLVKSTDITEQELGKKLTKVLVKKDSRLAAEVVIGISDNADRVKIIIKGVDDVKLRGELYNAIAHIDKPAAGDIVNALLSSTDTAEVNIGQDLFNGLIKKNIKIAVNIVTGMSDNNQRVKIIKAVDSKYQGDLISEIAKVYKGAAGKMILALVNSTNTEEQELGKKLTKVLVKKDSKLAAQVVIGISDNADRVKIIKGLDANLQDKLILAIAKENYGTADEIIGTLIRSSDTVEQELGNRLLNVLVKSSVSGGPAFSTLVSTILSYVESGNISRAVEMLTNIQDNKLQNRVFIDIAKMDSQAAIDIIKNLLNNGKEEITGKLMSALTENNSNKAVEIVKGLSNSERIKVIKGVDEKSRNGLFIAITKIDKTAAGEIVNALLNSTDAAEVKIGKDLMTALIKKDVKIAADVVIGITDNNQRVKIVKGVDEGLRNTLMLALGKDNPFAVGEIIVALIKAGGEDGNIGKALINSLVKKDSKLAAQIVIGISDNNDKAKVFSAVEKEQGKFFITIAEKSPQAAADILNASTSDEVSALYKPLLDKNYKLSAEVLFKMNGSSVAVEDGSKVKTLFGSLTVKDQAKVIVGLFKVIENKDDAQTFAANLMNGLSPEAIETLLKEVNKIDSEIAGKLLGNANAGEINNLVNKGKIKEAVDRLSASSPEEAVNILNEIGSISPKNRDRLFAGLAEKDSSKAADILLSDSLTDEKRSEIGKVILDKNYKLFAEVLFKMNGSSGETVADKVKTLFDGLSAKDQAKVIMGLGKVKENKESARTFSYKLFDSLSESAQLALLAELPANTAADILINNIPQAAAILNDMLDTSSRDKLFIAIAGRNPQAAADILLSDSLSPDKQRELFKTMLVLGKTHKLAAEVLLKMNGGNETATRAFFGSLSPEEQAKVIDGLWKGKDKVASQALAKTVYYGLSETARQSLLTELKKINKDTTVGILSSGAINVEDMNSFIKLLGNDPSFAARMLVDMGKVNPAKRNRIFIALAENNFFSWTTPILSNLAATAEGKDMFVALLDTNPKAAVDVFKQWSSSLGGINETAGNFFGNLGTKNQVNLIIAENEPGFSLALFGVLSQYGSSRTDLLVELLNRGGSEGVAAAVDILNGMTDTKSRDTLFRGVAGRSPQGAADILLSDHLSADKHSALFRALLNNYSKDYKSAGEVLLKMNGGNETATKAFFGSLSPEEQAKVIDGLWKGKDKVASQTLAKTVFEGLSEPSQVSLLVELGITIEVTLLNDLPADKRNSLFLGVSKISLTEAANILNRWKGELTTVVEMFRTVLNDDPQRGGELFRRLFDRRGGIKDKIKNSLTLEEKNLLGIR